MSMYNPFRGDPDRRVSHGTTTVVLADSHNLMRGTVRSLLDAERGLVVIGETGDGLAAARMLKDLEPNVAVIDIAMPGMSGMELARQICQSSPKTSVVIYSLFASQAYAEEAMRAGARACVSKTSSFKELLGAIREVAAGRTYFSPPADNRSTGRASNKRNLWRDNPGE